MSECRRPTIAVAELRIGHFVCLNLGWLEHPFPLSSFKISSEQQIATIRSLGLQNVEYDPERSDTPSVAASAEPTAVVPGVAARQAAAAAGTTASDASMASNMDQRQAQDLCERQYQDSARALKTVFDQLTQSPAQAGVLCTRLAGDMVAQLAQHEESALSLLNEGFGDRATQHAINVSVLSLLLGQAMGLEAATLEQLGVAALVHDAGKIELPERVRYRDESFSAAHFKLYQEHVGFGVSKAQEMGLQPLALLVIAQHHEMADGSGFPLGLQADKITPAARILALVNRYDGLCNPPNPLKALTPHAALSLIFASMKERFDRLTLNAFIRMMGVYPPGSVVQLTDQRYALVRSVNAARPLKPLVSVCMKPAGGSGAVTLDLQQEPGVGILRSLRPDQLPRQALVCLSPRQRICYYFERAVCVPNQNLEAG